MYVAPNDQEKSLIFKDYFLAGTARKQSDSRYLNFLLSDEISDVIYTTLYDYSFCLVDSSNSVNWTSKLFIRFI